MTCYYNTISIEYLNIIFKRPKKSLTFQTARGLKTRDVSLQLTNEMVKTQAEIKVQVKTTCYGLIHVKPMVWRSSFE